MIQAGKKVCGKGRLYPSPAAYDIDRDGKLDLMVSGMGDPYGKSTGGVAVYLNESAQGDAVFGAAVTLIEPSKKDSVGEPSRPDAGLHPEPVDIDGDLDLIVGGYSMWTPAGRELTDVERARAKAVEKQIEAVRAEMSALQQQAAKAYDKIRPQMAGLTSKFQPLQKELGQLKPRPQRVSFTWLYENLAR